MYTLYIVYITRLYIYEAQHYKMGQMLLNIKDSKIELKHKYIKLY